MGMDIGSWANYDLLNYSMKKRRVVLAVAFIAASSLYLPCMADVYYRMLFERMVFLMETTTYPQNCIASFQEIVKRHSYDRPYAARSQLYMGLCYKRMGSNLALQAFQDVIQNFPDQEEVIKAAEAELASLIKPKFPLPDEPEKATPRLIWKGKNVCGRSSLSPDGRYLSYIDLETGDLILYELADKKKRRLTNSERTASPSGIVESAAVSPDSKQVAYGWRNKSGESELRLTGIDGLGHRSLLHDKDIMSFHPVDWTADADQILASLTRSDLSNQIVFISVSDASIRPLKELGLMWPDHLRLSPDGRYIAYDLLQDKDSLERDIFMYSTEEEKETPMVVQPGDDMLLGWTPDGKNILYTSNRTGTTDAWISAAREERPLLSDRRIKANLGIISPLGLTKDGSFYYEVKTGKNDLSNTYSSVTEIWALENFLPEEKKILTVPDDYSTIQAAVYAAGPGDTIHVRKGMYKEDIIIDKSLTLQGEDRNSTIIDGGGDGTVVHITASHVLVQGFTVTNGDYGIEFWSTQPIHHITLRDLIITQNKVFGIQTLRTAGQHVIEDCILSHNVECSLFAHQFSRSVIRNCEAFGNGGDLRVGWSWHCIIEGNKVHHNRDGGISIDSCYNTTVERNLTCSNIGKGISLFYISSHNTIKNNIVFNNLVGIYNSLLWGGFGENRIFHNDILDNQTQVFEMIKGSTQFQLWDNGYPSGGNYWSDYKGRDTDQDGLGDIPHKLIGAARDNCPSVKPWNRLQAAVVIDPDVLRLDNQKDWIHAYVELPAGISVEDIDVSTMLMNNTVIPEKGSVSITDYDGDGVPELMMKLDKKELIKILRSRENFSLTITGKLKNGLPFEGSSSVTSFGK
jgi:parallel beta-helix repeat protein